MKNKKGFTLIELLVVIAIIGLLATLSIVALNNARSRARDSRRVADIKQIQTALELYYNNFNEYPPTADFNAGSIGTSGLFFMSPVPAAPLPADTGTCTSVNSYVYNRLTTNTYTLRYCLGAATGGIPAGIGTATESSIRTP